MIWFYDSSRQLLVYKDPEAPRIYGWKVNDLSKMGWNVFGINSLPRYQRG